MARSFEFEEKGYSLLKDLKFEISGGETNDFSICFWLYLTSSTSFPFVLLHQVDPYISGNVPFLVLNENKKLMLFPLRLLHKEAPRPGEALSWTANTYASSKNEFRLERWVHVGCQVSVDLLRLYVDGVMMGEKPLSSTLDRDSHLDGPRFVFLSCTHGEGDDNRKIQGYVNGVEILSQASSMRSHFLKDPPVQLFIDDSSVSDIEKDTDGVWSIVGGKAYWRRSFSLDVSLLDGIGQPVNKDLEVVASLLYADNEAPVEKPNDAKAPLLTIYGGIEFASWDRPSKLFNGRASFKLKISQLSSWCDNKLFCISFHIPNLGSYPFLKTISCPIRCISRNRNSHVSPLTWGNQNSSMHLRDGFQSLGLGDDSSIFLHNNARAAKQSPSSKRVKLAKDKQLAVSNIGIPSEQINKEGKPPACITNEDVNAYGTSSRKRQEVHMEADNTSPDSQSSQTTIPISGSMSSNRTPFSDSTVFRYCIEGVIERSLMLKEIAMVASEQDLMDFAEQVSLYTGCSHHRQQIILSKKLIEDGTKAWDMISENNQQVVWENLAPEIGEQFKKISCCSTRYLTTEDSELLRKIAGCEELVTRENFDKLWCWVYPVAYTISRKQIKAIWDSVLPKWIEGFITKEEAESSLQGPAGLEDPGTFVLRFPTSRSWPHPDAGNLVVTYAGSDHAIHHKLLSLDFIYSSGANETHMKSLTEMLLEEPELSRLARIERAIN